MSWAAVVVGGVSLGLGIYQTAKGNSDRKKLKRPEYQIPDEVYQNMSLAEQVAYEGLPASVKNDFQRNVKSSEAAMLSRSGDLQSGVSAMAASQLASQNALSNMYSQDAMMRLEGKRLMMGANTNIANFKDRSFGFDQQNYLQDLTSAQAMMGAGMQNMATGIGYGASALTDLDKSKKGDEKPPVDDGLDDFEKTLDFSGSGFSAQKPKKHKNIQAEYDSYQAPEDYPFNFGSGQ